MLKAITAIAVLLAIALGVILALALTKPDNFRVTRSIAINVPPEKIFPLIEDLRAWSAWSPYEAKDPAMKRSYSGAPRGPGAVYAWEGNNKVGSGRMEITEVTPPSRIVIKLDFITPFEGRNVAEFTLAPRAGATDVTWSMFGPAPLLSKIMQVFFNFDTMIGDDFAAGLAKLKSVAEK